MKYEACIWQPGCVTVSVRSVRVTVLAPVPQKLASIYKLYFFIKLHPPGHRAAQSLGETFTVVLCLSTTEDRPSWTVDNVPGKLISPQNRPLAPLFLLQIALFVTPAASPVIVWQRWRFSFIFFSLRWARFGFTFDLVYIPSTSH